MKKSGMKKRIQAGALFLAVLGSQCLGAFSAAADPAEYVYEGTTQVSSVDYYPAFDTMASTLTVEEVYVSAGSYVSEGDPILKLTDDSYQSALDYYNAAIIRAQNSLTNEELSYTQGMQSAEYDLDLALADEEQAPFVQEQSEAELADTIEEHEEVLTEMEERIEALEGGEYDTEGEEESGETLSDGTGSMSGGSGLSGGTASGSDAYESALLSETDAAQADQEITLDLTGGEDENAGQEKPGQETANGSEAGPDDAGEQELIIEEEQALLEAEAAAQEAAAQAEQAEAELRAQIAEKEEQIEDLQKNAEEWEEVLEEYQETEEELEKNIKEGDQAYNAILEEIYDCVLKDYNPSVICGAGPFALELAGLVKNSSAKTGSALEDTQDAELITQIEAEEAAEAEAAAQAEAAARIAAAQETLVVDDVTEAYADESSRNAAGENAAEENAAAASDVQQMDASDPAVSESETEPETEPETEDEDTLTLEELEALIQELYDLEAPRGELYKDYYKVVRKREKAESELKEVREQIADLQQEITDLEQEISEVQIEALAQSNALLAQDNASLEEDNAALAQENAALEEEKENLQKQIEEQSAAAAASSQRSSSSAAGSSALSDAAALADAASGQTDASSLAAALGITGSSDSTDASALAGLSGSGQGIAGVQNLLNAQESESMFGSTYDLSQAKALLERTAFDADEAEELLEDLYAMQDSVQLSYEELLRLKKPLQLEIGYQYDTAVFSARLAEITYEQTTAELDDELQSAQKTLSDLEEELQELESLGDGTVRAAGSGTLSAVNYAEGDTLFSMLPMYSVYDTDIVTVMIAVPQTEIAQIAVGDMVEVSIGSFSQMQGTVTEKAVEAQEGNSRTTINYEVEISIDNSSGRLSAGTAATVTVTAK